MSKLTPEEATEKHSRNLKASLPDMELGIGKVTTAPGQLAAKKQTKMLANLTKKIQDGTWARRVAGVSLEDWKTKMVLKGLPRVSGGIDAAHDKQVNFFSQLLPAIDAAQSKVKGMADLTLEDSINRMTTMCREMAKFRKK